MKTNDFDLFIRQQSRNLGLTLSSVAEQSGMSRPNLYKLMSGSAENARISTLVRLANTLRMHPIMLIRQMFEQNTFTNYANSFPAVQKDSSSFVRDVNVPDNSIVRVKQRFEKSWEIQNTGQITWQDRFLICVDQELEVTNKNTDFEFPKKNRHLRPVRRKVPIANVSPGESTIITAEFIAPDIPCSCFSYWKMCDKNDKLLFPSIEGLSCLVQVLYI